MTATTLYSTVLWLYAIVASSVFGASVYEAVVVHPAWSRKPPESFAGFMGAPVSRMNLPSFWVPVAPLFALSGLTALAVAIWAGTLGAPLMFSSVSAIVVVGWTLIYFRPTIERSLEEGGGNASAERMQSEARRWIQLNWIRVGLVAVSLWGVLTALRTTG
jgi:Domain of unknown function (DUF1772)